jgi:hypothetical protein
MPERAQFFWGGGVQVNLASAPFPELGHALPAQKATFRVTDGGKKYPNDIKNNI